MSAGKGPPQAFHDAFARLKSTVTEDDARVFQSTTLHDVRAAALDLENRLGERQSLRNMRRIQPFLAGLERYASAVDTLCNGTPYLPWIWAPVKLMLQLASDYVDAFERLISAYRQIAENLPRFDRLAATFKDDPDFQKVLAVFYADILEFHRRAYKFFRRRGWTFFFKSSWARFDTRFKGILSDLARHSELVDKEATAVAIVQANDWRTRWLEDLATQESKRTTSQFQDVLTWLEVARSEQEDEFDSLHSLCHPGSCDWIFEHPRIKSWIRQTPEHAVLWLNGKPGSGKTMLCSHIIKGLKQDTKTVVLYYFCHFKFYSDSSQDSSISAMILKSLAAQMLRHDRDLAPLIFDTCLSQNLKPSRSQMRQILPILISAFQSVRIIIDGLDECDESAQKTILEEILLLPLSKATGRCKVMISSQDVDQIYKSLRTRTTVSLSEEHKTHHKAIQGFAHSRFSQLIRDLDDISFQGDSVKSIEQALVDKANGMFLWVHLVLTTLENVYNIAEMRRAVDELPEGLDKVYERILRKIDSKLNAKRKIAVRVLEWIACAERPLKKFEVLDGIALHCGTTVITDETKVSKHVFDLCKPLLEDGPGGTVRFIHSSAKQYLLKPREPLKPAVAHYNIAFACISYLQAGLSLVDPEQPSKDRLVSVAKGFHGLHLYATENWARHLLTYSSINGKDDPEDSDPLVEQLTRLCTKHQTITRKLDTLDQQEIEKARPTTQYLGIRYLQAHKEVRSLVETYLDFQKASTIIQREDDFDPSNPRVQDPTLFTRAQQEYQALTRQLLQLQPGNGISESCLSAFKQTYVTSAYVCRFRGCPGASLGYQSEQELIEHESTHTMQLLCTDQSCEYSKLGFETARAFKRHMKEYHPEPSKARRRPDLSSRAHSSGIGSEEGNRESSEEPVGNDPQEEFIDPAFPPEARSGRGLYQPRFWRDDSFAMSTTDWDE